jgi:NAD(P) transhydrogenase subunit alpha
MKVLVPAESRPGENRVALVPESVGRLTALGLTVAVQAGAGLRSYATDDDYRRAGAEVIGTEHVAAALGVTDVVATVRPLHPRAVELLKPGAVIVSFLQPVGDLATVAAAANAGATALSFDLVPRISRAQSMDALTSQSLVSGYLAALVAATRLPKFFPPAMTAAGTIPPAKVLVLGAGVAGLQAMATARRLGAVVSGHDVRPSSAEEVRSVGATFLTLDLGTVQGAGGYAEELAADRAERQRQLLAPHVADSDVVITTAAVPGRPAPLLISAHTVASMRPGSVVVDLAAESGGNVEGSQPGAQVRIGGTLVWGATDVPSQLPLHASALYSANVEALLRLITAEGSLHVDLSDEVLDGCVVVHRGLVRDRAAADALGLQPVSAAPAPDEPATPPEPTDAAPADPASPDAPGEGA